MGKSIFVSVPCLGYDSELETTIKYCYENSSNKNEIFMGIAMVGNENFYNEMSKKFSYNKNIIFKYYPYENNLRVGQGRVFSHSIYNNQDYFFQIDSHMFFNFNWDEDLINSFHEAQKICKNNKVVLTGYGLFYKKNKNKIIYEYEKDTTLLYNFYFPKEYMLTIKGVPKWGSTWPENVSKKLYRQIKKTGFAPAPKTSSHLLFGDKELGNNLCADKNSVYWDEEVIQSIELIDNGFSLVFPGRIVPVYHFDYIHMTEEYGYRDNTSVFYEKNGKTIYDYEKDIYENYMKYMKNPLNYKKIKNFEKYSKFNVLKGAKSSKHYPKKYANYKKSYKK